MKKKEKIWIAVLLVITTIVVIFAVTRKNGKGAEVGANPVTETPIVERPEEKYVEVAEDGTKVNTSEVLKTEKTVNDVLFNDIQLTEKNGETVLIANVKNTGASAVEMFAVNITLIDENGQDLITVAGLVPPLAAGATGQFETSMTLDFANAYDFRVSAR